MSRVPAWQRDGWRPNGPGRCQCPTCGATVSTNAYARNRHKCATVIERRYREAYERARETNPVRASIMIAADRVGISIEQAMRVHRGDDLQEIGEREAEVEEQAETEARERAP